MKSLYLRIYLTVVASLAAFALVAGWMAQRHIDNERSLAQQAWAERTAAWAGLLQNSLPDAEAPPEQQQQSLLEWSRRLRLPMALDDRQGRRIGASPGIEWLLNERQILSSDDSLASSPHGHAPVAEAGRLPRGLVRLPLSDGRVLWVARLRGLREEGGPPDRGRPPFVGGLPGERGARLFPDRGPPGSRGLLGPPGPLGFPFPWLPAGIPLVVTLAVLFVAVALGAWPVVRRLTRRLEALQRGVRRFGEGDLQHRVAVDGNDEVAAVARSFNDAAQRVEELIRAHRSLLANASHEFRSPLARLKMALDLMGSIPPERHAALRQEIDHDIRELDELVEEVLLASRLDARADIESEPVDLLGIAAEEAARAEARLEVAPAAQVPDSLQLAGSDRLLRRALRNLLENARRYGVPPGMRTDEALELSLDRQGGDIVVRVCDRGPGVPLEARERIFEPFYRLPGHAERAGGVGLGLSLVRQIAEHHGGRVHCDARRSGPGSCFELRLPARRSGGQPQERR